MRMVPLLKAIIDADFSKSNLTMSLTLLMQLAGYGKTEDDLSDSRLEQLSGLRRDRARAAVREVMATGLFESAGKGRFGTIYRIPKHFLSTQGKAGFQIRQGVSETDAYLATDDAEKTNANTRIDPGSDTLDALTALKSHYQQLLDAHQTLVESHRNLVIANQHLVETNQLLAKTFPHFGNNNPILGESLPPNGVDSNPVLVTDNKKPLHTKTFTPNPPTVPQSCPHTDEVSQVDDSISGITSNHGLSQVALRYPDELSTEERAQAPSKLDGLHPVVAQEVLDVLAAKIAHGEVKKSTIGLLVWLANSARSGTFDRTPALEWRKQQQEQQGRQAKVTVTELNNLANEIKALQMIYKAGGIENPASLEVINSKKAAYFQKLEAHKDAPG